MSQETIEVYFQLIDIGLYHTLVVYTDKDGTQLAARGGTEEGTRQPPYGRLDTSVEPFVPGHIDFKYDTDKYNTDKYGGNLPPDAEYFPGVYDAQIIVASGDDLSGQWKSIADSFLSVDLQYGYSDFLGLVNCNAATRKALYAAELELPTFPAEKLPPDSMLAIHPDIPDSIRGFLKGTSDGYPNMLAPGLLPAT